MFHYEMFGVKLKNVQYVKDLGVKNASNLKFSEQYTESAGKSNRMLTFINTNLSFYHYNFSFLHMASGTCRLRVI